MTEDRREVAQQVAAFIRTSLHAAGSDRVRDAFTAYAAGVIDLDETVRRVREELIHGSTK